MTRRRRMPTPLWTAEFVIWCVAMVLLFAAGGVLLAVIASNLHWGWQ
jgi:hypothetical protein